MVRCSRSSSIYNLITLRVSCTPVSSVVRSRLRRKRCVVRHRSDSGWCHHLTGAFGVSVLLWWPCDTLSWTPLASTPSAPRCCWKQKLLSSFQTRSGALWASTGKTGSTSLAAVALASCLPWIGTSRDCHSLWAGLSWRPQPRSWNSCACNCCVWQRIRFCCKPRFCYPRYVCSSYLLSALGRWMCYLLSVYWRVVNSTDLL